MYVTAEQEKVSASGPAGYTGAIYYGHTHHILVLHIRSICCVYQHISKPQISLNFEFSLLAYSWRVERQRDSQLFDALLHSLIATMSGSSMLRLVCVVDRLIVPLSALLRL